MISKRLSVVYNQLTDFFYSEIEFLAKTAERCINSFLILANNVSLTCSPGLN